MHTSTPLCMHALDSTASRLRSFERTVVSRVQAIITPALLTRAAAAVVE